MSLSPDDEHKQWFYDTYLAPDAELRDRPSRSSGGPAPGGCRALLAGYVWLHIMVPLGWCLAAPAILVVISLTHPDLLGRFPETWLIACLSPVVALFVAWRSIRWQRDWRLLRRAVGLIAATSVIVFAVASWLAADITAFAAGDPKMIWLLTNMLGVVIGWATYIGFTIVCRRQ